MINFNIKKLIMLFMCLMTMSCTLRIEKELDVKNDNYRYFIKYPKNWDFDNYGTDADRFFLNDSDYIIDPIATIVKGNRLDAKIRIYVFDKKINNGCILSAKKDGDYDEFISKKYKKISFDKEGFVVINQDLINKWYNDNPTDIKALFFGINTDQCILFDLSNQNENKRNIGNDFYKVIKSLKRIKK